MCIVKSSSRSILQFTYFSVPSNNYKHSRMLLFFITFVSDNTPILQSIGANSTGFLMRQCQGDCDSDSDCKDGMVCFHREAGGGVPGCAGNPNSNIADYCIREEDRTTIETVYFFGGSKQIKQSVVGSTRSCRDQSSHRLLPQVHH